MNKFNKAAINRAEQSFRDLLKLDIMKDVKKQFIHDFKNLCHHSDVGNLFDHYLVSKVGDVNLVYAAINQIVECGDTPFISEIVEGLNAVAIELNPERAGVRRAYLMISADTAQIKPVAEIHVHYYSVGKVIYPVKTDNLHNTLLLAIGK
ncbi:hypothetical protein N1M2_62 [Klebsiella phage N1M2]|uniref:Uncharacterized protein n=1 Tax=Klebsiella phage N1M2 TaxID=2664939 RepID=A0A6B7ZET9_9CAUD|nr:hypothetical protein PQB72_gp062 [Klebsiella phage N1M2]QGH71925.1 hypothetical protein N1M2_62 [Klebsiella phage N1M2]